MLKNMIAHSLLLKRKSVQLHRSNLPLFGTGKQGGVVKHVAAGTLPSLQPFIKAKGHIPSISTVDTKYQHGIGIIYNPVDPGLHNLGKIGRSALFQRAHHFLQRGFLSCFERGCEVTAISFVPTR